MAATWYQSLFLPIVLSLIMVIIIIYILGRHLISVPVLTSHVKYLVLHLFYWSYFAWLRPFFTAQAVFVGDITHFHNKNMYSFIGRSQPVLYYDLLVTVASHAPNMPIIIVHVPSVYCCMYFLDVLTIVKYINNSDMQQ